MSTIRAVFMGSDLFSLPALQALVAKGPELPTPVHVAGVVTQPDRAAGRGRSVQPNAVKVLAQGSALPVLQPERVREPEALASILALKPDVLIVASFGQILPRSLIEAPSHRALNLHPSLLPLYRGPSPVVSAILAGDQETGLSLMVMAPRMDAGPVLSQDRTPIGQDETGGELTERLARLGAEVLLRDLPGWIRGELPPEPQDESRAAYTQRIRKEDGLIDWTLPAITLARRARAFNPWPTAYTHWGNRLLRILRARPGDRLGRPGQVLGMRDGALEIGTGSGTLLAEELQLAGGKALPAEHLVRGHRELISAHLGGDA